MKHLERALPIILLLLALSVTVVFMYDILNSTLHNVACRTDCYTKGE